MKFDYTAVNNKNKKISGSKTADSRAEVVQFLREKGLTPIEIKENTTGKDAPSSIWNMEINTVDIHKYKLKPKRLLILMNQMALMMKSGISLSMSMEVMIDTEKDAKLKQMLEEINSLLYSGIPLSEAMGQFAAFPEVVINLVQAGEANGRLDMSFQQASLIMQKEIALTGKVKSAMMYPLFLIILTIALVIVLTMFVLPKFAGIFTDFGAELPALTKGVMAFSNFLIDYWPYILLVVAIIVIPIVYLKKTSKKFLYWWHKTELKIPLIGNVLRVNAVARWCRMMSTLTDAGVTILRSLELSRDVISNMFVKEQLGDIIEDVKVGVAINAALAKNPLFDPILVSMVRVGEESGMLTDSLLKMADLFEEQADEAVKKMTDMMTPIMTIVIGVVVGTVVLSVVIPMFGMYDIIQ